MEGRMTIVRVKANGVRLVIYSCYCPTEEHSTSSKETFCRTLHRAIQKTRKEVNILRIRSLHLEISMQPLAKTVTTRHGEELVPTTTKILPVLTEQNSLKALNVTSFTS